MKRWGIALAVLFGLAAVAIAIGLWNLDTARIAQLAADQASTQLGRKVELGDVKLAFFPPGVRIRNVRIAGDPGAPTLAEVEAIALGIAFAPLLRGSVEVGTLELDGPRLELPVDKDGMPVPPKLPGDGQPAGAEPQSRAEKPPAEPAPTARPDDAKGGSPVSISIDRFAITRGQLTAGPWRVRDIEIDGSLESLSSAQASLAAVIEGIARLEGGKLEAQDLTGAAPRIRVEGTLRDVDLPALVKALPEPPSDLAIASGRAAGPFSAELVGSDVKVARANLAIESLDVRSGTTEVKGAAKVDVGLGDRFSIDLQDTGITVPDTFAKPTGQKLALSGPLGAEPSLAALSSAVLAIGSAQIPLTFSLAGTPQRVEIGRTSIDLASFAPWIAAAPGPISGTVKSEGLRVALDPLRIDGALQLDAVSVAIDKLKVAATGAVQARGTRLAAENLQVAIDDQMLRVSGGYDLDAGTLDATASAQTIDVEKLVTAVRGSSELTGTLTARVELAGPPDPTLLRGGGEFALTEGRIRGFSLVRQFMGQFSDVGLALAKARGKDLSRYEEEEFERLGGRFTLTPGTLQFQSLDLVYRNARADLQGTVGIPGGELAMRGDLTIRKELGAALAGSEGEAAQAQVKEEVIPIEGVGGTVSSPRIALGRAGLAALAARYAGSGRLQEKLQEKLGKGGAEAVQGILEGVFGGGKRKRSSEPPPEDNSGAPEERERR
jgi:uncharacterized protein involved in outer membrane biogenesis